MQIAAKIMIPNASVYCARSLFGHFEFELDLAFLGVKDGRSAKLWPRQVFNICQKAGEVFGAKRWSETGCEPNDTD